LAIVCEFELYPVLGQWEVIFNTIFLYNYKTINQQAPINTVKINQRLGQFYMIFFKTK